MSSKEELLKRLSDGVLDMEEEDVAEAAREYLESGYPALDGIMEGLIDGMNRAGQLFEEEEYFVTDILLCCTIYLRQLVLHQLQVFIGETDMRFPLLA